ncbi:MAG: hypothetical protein HYX74_03830 [Acidobacteria bacterium]|nr:hypothetical protein [Acidobacteriota bacterium]
MSPESSGSLLAALVRSLLPENPALEPAQRAVVERQVVEFVAAQIGAMPRFLRVPYRIAMRLFDGSAVLRYGRRYTALDGFRQRQYVEAWAGSSLGVMRDFVRLIRSCALLRYWDHPWVVARLEAAPDAEEGRKATAEPGALATGPTTRSQKGAGSKKEAHERKQ